MSSYSIVINNYNYDQYIEEALESCLAQDRSLLREVWVVDDGSTDGSRAVIEEYADRHEGLVKAIFKENGGQLSAIKAGVLASSSDILCFLDSDDFFSRSDYLNILDAVYSRGKADCGPSGRDGRRLENQGRRCLRIRILDSRREEAVRSDARRFLPDARKQRVSG
jgi:glycosyltransferase involved in cell wall biosynthesis